MFTHLSWQKLALTGRPGIGKSTLVSKIVSKLESELSVGGIIVHEIREEGRRIGFEMEDLTSGSRMIMASVDHDGPRLGKYGVYVENIERFFLPAIISATAGCDLIVIDELGPVQFKCPAFIPVIEKALLSTKSMLLTFKLNYRHPLIEEVERVASVLEVTEENRDQLFATLLMR